MARTIVAVLRGGDSNEYALSLKTGAAMLAALPEDTYDARDIFIDRKGSWHYRGRPTPPPQALQQIDVVLNALHGGSGEDGTLQRFLERTGIPYAGSGTIGATQSMHKIRTHQILETAGVKMPQFIAFNLRKDVTTADMARETFAAFGPPYILKPVQGGASEGIRIANTINDLPDAIGDMLDRYEAVLVEEFVRGIHVSVAVIEGFRREPLYVLPPSQQIIPEGARHIMSHHHDQALVTHVCPTRLSFEEKNAIEDAARAAHNALSMRHFSRIDMIKTPRTAYVLDVNATPGLYPGSSMPVMLESVGSSVPEFLEHAIDLARTQR